MVFDEFFAVMMMNFGFFCTDSGSSGNSSENFWYDRFFFLVFGLSLRTAKRFSPRLGGPGGMVTICLLLGGVRVFVGDKKKVDRNSHE